MRTALIVILQTGADFIDVLFVLILSIVLLVTFFRIASRLGNIKETLNKLYELELKKSNKDKVNP